MVKKKGWILQGIVSLGCWRADTASFMGDGGRARGVQYLEHLRDYGSARPCGCCSLALLQRIHPSINLAPKSLRENCARGRMIRLHDLNI